MNAIRPTQQHDDRLDQLLSDFFKSEMPRSLPVPTLPEEPVRTLRFRRSSFFSSRAALAASVLLLLLGSLFLSGAFKGMKSSSDGLRGNDTADKAHHNKMFDPMK